VDIFPRTDEAINNSKITLKQYRYVPEDVHPQNPTPTSILFPPRMWRR